MSDIDESNKLPAFVKCDSVKMDDSPESNPIGMRNGRRRPRNVKQKPKSENPGNESEMRSTVDVENRYHCLDCGKKFNQKSAYNQHQRL